jgi:hypothetical protein
VQPSRPATAIDATFLKRSGLGNGPDGELQSTYSLVSGGLYSTVLGAVLNSDYTLPIADLGCVCMCGDWWCVPVCSVGLTRVASRVEFDVGCCWVWSRRYGPSDTVVVIEANTTSTYSLIHAGGALTVKACAKWDFQLYSVAPVLPNGVCPCVLAIACVCERTRIVWVFVVRSACFSEWAVVIALVSLPGWAVIGETVKWVPVNNARITSIAYSASSVTVTAAGVNGESLTVGVEACP